jgi:hypothetical protein
VGKGDAPKKRIQFEVPSNALIPLGIAQRVHRSVAGKSMQDNVQSDEKGD